ncbi:MAG: MMPL family transporter [Planctomycetes bacterium]|nr:MMPL family transporter [Planctomycetota bacterium]
MRRRAWVLTLLAAATAVLAWQAARLNIRTTFTDLLPQKHPYVQIHNEFHETFGGGNLVLLAVERRKGTVFEAATLKKIEQITEAIDRMEGVNHYQLFSIAHRKAKTVEISGSFVEQKSVMWPKVPTDPEAIREVEERVGSSLMLVGPYVSPDHSAVLISAQFHDGRIDYRNLFDEFKRLIDTHSDEKHAIYVAGVPMLVGWGYHYLSEILWAFVLTLSIMVLILWSYFRTWQGVLVPLFSALVSAVWGLGFASLLGLNLDPLILVVPMLVSARALSHSVQFMEKFYETLKCCPDKREAATRASGTLWAPGILGIGTDAVGILLIATSTIPIMQKLAFICSMWAASVLFSVLVLNPILLSVLPVPKRAMEACAHGVGGGLDRLLGGIASLVRFRRATVGAAVLLGATAYFISKGLIVGDRTVSSGILRADSHYDISLRKINEKFFGASPFFVFVRGKERHSLTEPEVARTVEAFQRTMEEDPRVKGTISYVDLIRYFHQVMREGDPKWFLLPRDKRSTGSLLSCIADTSQPGDIERFLTMNYQHAVVQVFYEDTRGTTVAQAAQRAKAFIDSHPMEHATFELAGGVVGLKAATNEEVVYSHGLTFGLILLCILLGSSLTFGSPIIGLLLTGCLAVSNFFVYALMTWWGVALNVHTLPVSSVGIGIGVDYGFYLMGRVREEMRKGENLENGVGRSIRTTGKAIFLTAMTLIAGVGLWHFMTHVQFIGEMGLLLGLLMLFSMILALLVFPSALLLLKSSPRSASVPGASGADRAEGMRRAL